MNDLYLMAVGQDPDERLKAEDLVCLVAVIPYDEIRPKVEIVEVVRALIATPFSCISLTWLKHIINLHNTEKEKGHGLETGWYEGWREGGTGSFQHLILSQERYRDPYIIFGGDMKMPSAVEISKGITKKGPPLTERYPDWRKSADLELHPDCASLFLNGGEVSVRDICNLKMSVMPTDISTLESLSAVLKRARKKMKTEKALSYLRSALLPYASRFFLSLQASKRPRPCWSDVKASIDDPEVCDPSCIDRYTRAHRFLSRVDNVVAANYIFGFPLESVRTVFSYRVAFMQLIETPFLYLESISNFNNSAAYNFKNNVIPMEICSLETDDRICATNLPADIIYYFDKGELKACLRGTRDSSRFQISTDSFRNRDLIERYVRFSPLNITELLDTTTPIDGKIRWKDEKVFSFAD